MRAVEHSPVNFCDRSLESNLKRHLATQEYEHEAHGYVSLDCKTGLNEAEITEHLFNFFSAVITV